MIKNHMELMYESNIDERVVASFQLKVVSEADK